MLSEESSIDLPLIPSDQAGLPVAAWSAPIAIDTYEPAAADEYPQFLDTRVYQGSSGKVFPLPFHERIEPAKRPHTWDAIHLENEWMRVVILPELGGRIHIAYDKANDYDIFYRNNVIKPALVGLTGPWISGGVEFNWPQHHRPATYLPTDTEIEREDDGSVTVWCSDHDPFARMKGMHGIRLRPGSSAIEARVRLFNRSEQTETFLWWANVAAAVGDDYQSFFPTDVHHVADHAKRAVVDFPRVAGEYYGVDYPARVDDAHPDADRIDWYRNIPVPTSYMVTRTEDSFFGGYDHGRGTGFVHWADRSISPGKKQWTWGDAPFGHAWDANLTDTDGPYVELMAGVYTDNQPDFSFLAPGETKSFSQFWYPIAAIGPAMQATREAAIRVDLVSAGTLRVGVATSLVARGTVVEVCARGGAVLASVVRDITPGEPLVEELSVPGAVAAVDLLARVVFDGRTLVEHAWGEPGDATDAPASAVAPPVPSEVGTTEELHIVATYLQQYRHATRSPEPYWQEALRRDPGDIRSHVALGARRYREACYDAAIDHADAAIARETTWAPNPADGQAHYQAGLALNRAGRRPEARRALEKATWNAAQAGAAHTALARMLAADEPLVALDHARRAWRGDVENVQVRDILVVLLRAAGRDAEAEALLAETLRLDPLDQWARDLAGREATVDSTILLDVALEYASMGCHDDAERLFRAAEAASSARPSGQVNVGPLAAYHRAAAALRQGDVGTARAALVDAARYDGTHALPSRLDDIDALTVVAAFDDRVPLVWSMLGSWYYDVGRAEDAVWAWRRGLDALDALEALGDEGSAALRAVLHRNLGIAAYNVEHDEHAAVQYFQRARDARPRDARLLYESDQLASRTGVPAVRRLAGLDADLDLVAARDDLSVQRARLLTEVGRPDEARTALSSRRFQPWEGGEGVVLGAWDEAALSIARAALAEGDGAAAVDALELAMSVPTNLGEARHPLATTADLHLALGDAYAAVGATTEARRAWETAAVGRGDFTDMATAAFTERSVWSILALHRLGREEEAAAQLTALAAYIEEEARREAVIDYFATSLPTMLLFHDDPTVERDTRVRRLRDLHAELAAALATRRDAGIR